MKKEIFGWGKYPRLAAEVFEPNSIEEICDIVQNQPSILARGEGKSYGDAGLNDTIISLKKLNKITAINNDAIEVEAGCTLLQVLDAIVPHQKFLKVTPGICGISIGGAIASDVHGKNHFNSGSFYNIVSEIKVVLENGVLVKYHREKDGDIFGAYFGSMGLKGIIVGATIELTPLKSLYLDEQIIATQNISEFIDIFEQQLKNDFCVGWLNLAQRNPQLLVKVANWSEAKRSDGAFIFRKAQYALFPFSLPIRVPKWAFNLFNKWYYSKATKQPFRRTKMVDYFYPLDTITNWNNVYGSNGLLQYHFNVSLVNAKQALNEAIQMVCNSNAICTMAVIKRFGKGNKHTPYSFPQEGYNLAFDFVNDEKARTLIHQLDDMVEKYQGSIYKTKDAMSRLGNVLLTNKFNSIQNNRYNR